MSRTSTVVHTGNLRRLAAVSATLASCSRGAAALIAVGLLGTAVQAQAIGTDFCLPGQNGVLPCPCNNSPAGNGKGCANFGPGQVGESALLVATGVASITDGSDTLQLQATGENNFSLTLFMQSSSSTSGALFGAGISCLAAAPLVLYHGNAGTGEPQGQITRPVTGIDPEIHTRSTALGDAIVAGQTRYYMAGYRDKKAAYIQNCNDPTKTINSTQGVAIVWVP